MIGAMIKITARELADVMGLKPESVRVLLSRNKIRLKPDDWPRIWAFVTEYQQRRKEKR